VDRAALAGRPERLQKILAAAGIASRRGAEALLRAGRVSVNGRPVKLGESADLSRDTVRVDGRRVELEPLVYWLVHKPVGLLSTARDPRGRGTVLDLVDAPAARLYPVGRLDRDTEGLLLLTNDGAVAHALLHPSHGIEREYVVTVRGRVSPTVLERLARGVRLGDARTAPAVVAHVRHDARGQTTRLHLTLTEGRKRQIRRSLRALGHPVLRLVRIRFGPLRLGRLAPGAARGLTDREQAALRRLLEAAPAARRGRS
jgi:23S rRNA pseudouridine2605 synthase